MFLLVRVAIVIFEQVAFFLTYLDFTAMKVLSWGQYMQLNQPGSRPRVPNKSTFLYLSQLISCLVMIAIKIVALIVPGYLIYSYTSFSWLWVILGPFCLFVPWYIGFFCNASTIYHFYEKFQNFNPQFSWRALLEGYNSCVDVGRTLFRILKPCVISVYEGLKEALSSIKFFLPKGGVFNSYKNMLISAGRFLKTKGAIGDLIFTPLTLFWIFWPLLIPYYLSEWYLLIPIFPIEIFLIIKGYATAKLAWS